MFGRLFAVACLTSLSFAHLPNARADEARFLGRTRGEWVAELDVGPGSGRRRKTHAAWGLTEMAIRFAKPDDALVWLNEVLLLCEDESPSVRYWGLLGVQQLAARLPPEHAGRAAALKMLDDALDDQSQSVRIAAAETLGLLGQPERALPVLTVALENPQDSVRIQAVAAFEKLGEAARPAEKTLQTATGDSSEYVKRISTRALDKLRASK